MGTGTLPFGNVTAAVNLATAIFGHPTGITTAKFVILTHHDMNHRIAGNARRHCHVRRALEVGTNRGTLPDPVGTIAPGLWLNNVVASGFSK
jgi:hypothetical protein